MVASLEDGNIHKPQSSDSEEEVVVRSKHIRRKFVDSDSDEDHTAPVRDSEEDHTAPVRVTEQETTDSDDASSPVLKKKSRVLLNSESEPEDDVEDNVGSSQPAEAVSKSADKVCEESSNDESSVPKKVNSTWYKDSTLYDAEESDDEAPQVAHSNVPSNEEASLWESESPSGAHKTKQKPKSSAKSIKKSSKTDKTEVQKIYSESQRMLREAKLSLPYHKPRQRSLAEFLQRRRSLPPMPKSLKVSSEQMKEICKQLEEREKEAKEFFKSESEDSDVDKTSEDAGDDKTPKDTDADKTPKNADDDGCVNQESLRKLCAGTDEIPDSTNKATLDTKNKTEGTTSNSDKFELHDDVEERNITVNEDNSENTRKSSSVSVDGNVSVESIVLTDTDVQGTGDFHMNDMQKLHSVALKLFGSNVGNSGIDQGKTSATDVPATSIRTFLSEDTAATIADMSDQNVFKPSMSESSQVALDCAYDETAADTFIFKEPVQPPVAETTTNSELDSQGLVLYVSEEFDKDEELLDPVASLKVREQNSSSNSEEPQNNEDRADASKTFCNISANTVRKNVASNDGPTESDIILVKNNCINESVEPNLPAIDTDVHGRAENKDVGGLTLTEKVTVRSESDSQCEKQLNNSETKVKVSSSESICAAVNDGGGALSNRDSVSQTHDEDRTERKSTSFLGDAPVFRPRLVGDYTDIIDLEEVPKPVGIRKFIERFIKHSSTKKKPQQKKHVVELGVVSAEKGPDGMELVKKDVLSVTLGEDEKVPEDPQLARPGAKFRRLKEELQLQIARQREEEWSKLEQEDIAEEKIRADEMGHCSPLENEAEEEVTESESEDEEAEEEEDEEFDNLKFREKKKIKSAFVDDEAEVSDEGNAADVSSDEEDEEIDDDNIGGDTKSGVENVGKKIEEKVGTKEILHDNPEAGSDVHTSTQPKTKFHRLKQIDMFDLRGGDSSDDVGLEDTCPIPAYQPGGGLECGGAAPLSEEKASQHHFLSPIVSLPTRSSRASSVKSAENTPQTCEDRGLSRLHLTQKKLFAELEPVTSQDNEEELQALCSGNFEDVRNEVDKLVNPLTRVSQSDQDSELLGLCSGKFESQVVQLTSLEEDKWRDTTESSQMFEDSQDLRLTLTEDVLSPVKADCRLRQENTPQPTQRLESSDEESSVLTEITMKRKLKHSHKKLEFSDDESGHEDTEHSTNYKSLLNDSEDDGAGSVHSDMVVYDSEENEIVVPTGKGKVRSTAEFFENEAELSESEWGSADEDEQGLDVMDSEDGDEEELDSKKVKEQLDKIHMRRMMDDDNREVRLLQELLFEDGELHSEGGGRQRKFRWKNADNPDENYQPPDAVDEDVYDVDDEDEEQWRRLRHEREKFLLEQQAKGDAVVEDVVPEDDCKLMKLGKAALKRIRGSSSQELEQENRQEHNFSKSESLVSPDPKREFQLLVKRGSFLARGEMALARLAHLSKGSADQNINGPKNSRKFVFATISPEKEDNSNKEAAQVKVQKRRSVEVTPPVIKKLRLSEEVSEGRCLLDLLVP